ncbi:histidine triad nucleotide-binding protein [Haliovirga abyssi]|uniref:Histidine triad nucleotide-binding protein n=2 Tax=Haliovirga abyssi TaxID=2996794 RepID=A0AAU9DYC9_9FUSO|nr:histidine triad nucleotide-binding protein [Haliovirga abyssi]
MCLFCKIVNKEIPAKIVYEDNNILAFEDINPKAPVHILVIPKKHIETLNDINNENSKIIGEIYAVIANLAKEKGISKTGYRVVANCNRDAGQEVFHIHFHLMGGRKFQWPAG